MIKDIEWEYRKTKTSYDTSEESILVAKLRFKKETAPQNKASLKERISKEGLSSYLFDQEDLRSNKGENKYYGSRVGENERTSRTLTISYPWFQLGFDIKVYSAFHLPEIELLDLGALNHFCLTGDYTQNSDSEKPQILLEKLETSS